MEVYLVWEGLYEYTCVLGVFKTEELAKEYIKSIEKNYDASKLVKFDSVIIEEYEVIETLEGK